MVLTSLSLSLSLSPALSLPSLFSLHFVVDNHSQINAQRLSQLLIDAKDDRIEVVDWKQVPINIYHNHF
jgi:hypothetical protein